MISGTRKRDIQTRAVTLARYKGTLSTKGPGLVRSYYAHNYRSQIVSAFYDARILEEDKIYQLFINTNGA